MAFQLPPLPNFNVNIPQMPDALTKMTQMGQLKDMLSGTAARNALLPLQVQEQQQKIEQEKTQTATAQLELQSQQAMMKAWSDPDFTKKITGTDTAATGGSGFDPNVMLQELSSRGVLPKDAQGIVNSFIERSKNMAAATKDQIENYAKAHQALADMLAPITDMPVEKASAALANVKAKLLAKPIPGLDQQDLALVNHADLEHLPAMINVLGLNGQIADYHKKNAEAAAAGQKVVPTNDKGQATGLSVEAQQGVLKDVAVATNPQVQAGKVAVATAEGQARANIEAQIARGSNAALANVPPHMVSAATADATKAGTEYAQAVSVTQRLNAMMDAAKKGNVVSYQLIPQEGALQLTTSQGVHRINMAEIQNYGGGSLWQRMEGHIGKALEGKSIPDSVLNDMAEMQKIQAEGARTKYENTLKTVNQAYGSNFKPVEMETNAPTPAASGVMRRQYLGATYEQQKDGTWKKVQ